MFFYVVDTHTKCIINDFAPAPRTNILIFQCHTVTHGTDLRKSPLWCYKWIGWDCVWISLGRVRYRAACC